MQEWIKLLLFSKVALSECISIRSSYLKENSKTFVLLLFNVCLYDWLFKLSLRKQLNLVGEVVWCLIQKTQSCHRFSKSSHERYLLRCCLKLWTCDGNSEAQCACDFGQVYHSSSTCVQNQQMWVCLLLDSHSSEPVIFMQT